MPVSERLADEGTVRKARMQQVGDEDVVQYGNASDQAQEGDQGHEDQQPGGAAVHTLLLPRRLRRTITAISSVAASAVPSSRAKMGPRSSGFLSYRVPITSS